MNINNRSVTSSERVLVEPRDTGAPLTNPGMGWVLYYYDQHMARYGASLSPSDTVDDFPGVGVIYMAAPWAFLEPEEGEYDWAVLDTPAQRWIEKGKQVAFRFPCCEPFYEYATPAWVQEAGAVFHAFKTSARTRQWMRDLLDADIPTQCFAPDYGDPVFLAKHAAFLAAAAQRYDGNPSVAYIDVGSFGTWGEGHTFLSCGRHYDASVKKCHLNMYRAQFANTLLVAGDDLLKINGKDNEDLVAHAVQSGMALRDDSVLVDSLDRIAESEEMACRFWPNVPVILEPAHYGQATQWWDTWRDGSPYLESIERYHASYAGVHWWPRAFLNENRALIDQVNRRLGYRIQLTQASWPPAVAVDTPWTVRTQWRNAGVAPCYSGGYPALTLKDADGGIVAVFVLSSCNVRELREGQDLATETVLCLPEVLSVAPGVYGVFVSVGALDGTPQIALPLEGTDERRRYRIGNITVIRPSCDGHH